MWHKTLLSLTISLFFLLITSAVSADEWEKYDLCKPNTVDVCKTDAKGNKYSCEPAYYDNGNPVINHNTNKQEYICKRSAVLDAFGRINAPPPLAGLLEKDRTGAGAISTFLSNGINLIYTIATIILIFMILWGAFEWLTSGGDKEKVASAQRRLINAFIGILLFAAAFAIISVLGAFTGFKFFEGQNSGYYCYNGSTLNRSKSPPVCVNDELKYEFPAVFCNDNQTWTGTVCKNR